VDSAPVSAIWQLLSYGLLRSAFRPRDAVCPLRAYVRQAKRLIEDRARCVQHMQRALTEMNIRLDSVLADIMGQTGQKILRAIIGGERDARRLASFRDRRVKASGDTIAASLEGTWREEHLFALEQAMQRYDFLERQIEDCEARGAAQIERLTPASGSPSGDEGAGDGSAGEGCKTLPRSRGKKSAAGDRALTMALYQMGVDLTAIPAVGTGTVLTIASEIGPDFSVFPSAKHFCSWMGVAPETRINGGKPLPGRAPKVVNPVGQALRMTALAARRSQTFIGARHRARLARKDRAVAITATARELACLIYLMVTRGEEYVGKGMDAYEKRRIDRIFANLNRKARTLGYRLVQAVVEEVPTALQKQLSYSRESVKDVDLRRRRTTGCDSGKNWEADAGRTRGH